MDRTRRDTLLGLVFFGTLAFLLWATVNLTDASLDERLEVWFADAGGAQAGTNVLVLGMRVGKVNDVEVFFDRPELPVRLTLKLDRRIQLTDEMRIEVQADGVLGGKLIYIDPGRGAPISGDDPLIGVSQKNLFDRLGDVADGKGPLGENVQATVTAIRKAFEALQDEQNTIGRLMTRRDLYDEVLDTVAHINGILKPIQDGESTFGRLAMDAKMGERVQFFVDNLAQASEKLTKTDGTIGMLLNDPETAQNARSILADVAVLVADAKAGRGIVGRILRDDTLAGDFTNAVANLNVLLDKATDPDAGLLGAAISDPESAEHFKIAMANIRDVTDKLTQSEGALGILINDKDVGIRLRRIFTQVARALEDAREAAPISSFVQVLLGVF